MFPAAGLRSMRGTPGGARVVWFQVGSPSLKRSAAGGASAKKLAEAGEYVA
ncbi:MAG: hypothetical protein AB7L65_05795 [Hyphomonadaceae bacterium]